MQRLDPSFAAGVFSMPARGGLRAWLPALGVEPSCIARMFFINNRLGRAQLFAGAEPKDLGTGVVLHGDVAGRDVHAEGRAPCPPPCQRDLHLLPMAACVSSGCIAAGLGGGDACHLALPVHERTIRNLPPDLPIAWHS